MYVCFYDICCCLIDIIRLIGLFKPQGVCLNVTQINVNILRYTQAHVYTRCLFSLTISKTSHGLK